MGQPINNFKLGLFALCGLALLVAGIFALGARSYFESTSLFETYVEGEVTGLTVGSAVELRGVRVGKVSRIDFSWADYQFTEPNYVVVEFEMRDDVAPLPPGAAQNKLLQSAIERGFRARVKGKGITGTSILSLEYVNPIENPPLEVPWTPRHTYIPSAPGEFGELLASAQKTLRNIERLDFSAINQMLQDDLKSAGRLLDNAGRIDFASLNTNANSLLTDLRGSSSRLKSFIEDAEDTVKKMKLEKLTGDLDAFIGQLHDTVSQLQPGMANIDFAALNQTLTGARQAIHDLDDVLAELKKYPSGFLFGKPPAALKGVERSPKP